MNRFGLLPTFLLLLAGYCPAQTPNAPASGGVDDSAHYSWADVLRVDPVYAPAETTQPKQECWEEQVPVREVDDSDAEAREHASRRNAAGVIGAIIGGLIGNRVGKGDGRKVATLAGALAGGAIGSNLAAEKSRPDDTGRDEAPVYVTRRHCRRIDSAHASRRVLGYDVEYRYRGDVYSARLPHDPGDRLRVRVSVTPTE